MGQVVDYARALAADLRAAGVKATTKASAAVPPCVLVEAVPGRSYDIPHGYTATWRVVCLAPAPGDEKAAEQLEDLVDRVAALLPIETATAVTYRLPTAGDPVPGVLCTFTNEVENHDQGL